MHPESHNDNPIKNTYIQEYPIWIEETKSPSSVFCCSPSVFYSDAVGALAAHVLCDWERGRDLASSLTARTGLPQLKLCIESCEPGEWERTFQHSEVFTGPYRKPSNNHSHSTRWTEHSAYITTWEQPQENHIGTNTHGLCLGERDGEGFRLLSYHSIKHTGDHHQHHHHHQICLIFWIVYTD